MENDKQKNRKNAILASLFLALIFAYPTFTAAKNVVVDGYIQWTSLILTMFLGIWVLLPFAIVLFYKGDGPKQRDEKNDRRISQRCTKVLGIAYGLVFFGIGIFALIYYFGYKDVMPEDLRRIDGTISEVVIEGLRGRKNHTSVLLIEYPQYCFFMPFIDETLEEESPITLYVSVSDYQRVVEGRALANREQHTIDQYSPYVMAYESGKSHVTLSDYNDIMSGLEGIRSGAYIWELFVSCLELAEKFGSGGKAGQTVKIFVQKNGSNSEIFVRESGEK